MASRVMGVLTIATIVLAALPHSGQCHPITQVSNEELQIQRLLENRENVKVIEKILEGMEKFMATNLYRLFNKINSLSQVVDEMVTLGPNSNIYHGMRGDMSSRCPKGFQAVPGDKKCYYLSTYKQPWTLAREYCYQLGPDVEMLQLDTTKRQFIVTHLIQSDPEAKKVKRWWTAGKSSGREWVWNERLDEMPFFNKFFANKEDETNPGDNACMVLDADSYYQWKKVKCYNKTDLPQSMESDYSHQPAHHFVCQTSALEPSSIETASDSTEQGSRNVGRPSIESYHIRPLVQTINSNTTTKAEESAEDESLDRSNV